MHKVDSALELVKDADRKERPLSTPSRLLAITTPFQVETICAGVIPLRFCESVSDACYETRHIPAPPSAKQTKARTGDEDFETLYFTRSDDPASPVVWTRGDGSENDWRAGSGLIYPSKADEKGIHGLGFFGPSMTLDESTRVTLSFFAAANMDRMLRTRPYRLTPRQLEALQWAADGKTDQEIAQILGISGHTVDKYMRQTKESLDAVNRTVAIVRAIRYGLIG